MWWGKLKRCVFFRSYQFFCEEQGLGKVEVKLLGGLEALVVMENAKTAENVLKDNEHGLRRWMQNLRSGESYNTTAGRLTWISILGLPVTCWGEVMFKK